VSTSSLCGRLTKGLLDIDQLNGWNGLPITAARLSVEFIDAILPRCKTHIRNADYETTRLIEISAVLIVFFHFESNRIVELLFEI